MANFPSSFGMVHNRFTNQNSKLNDEGDDSGGNLPLFADEPNNDIEDYVEARLLIPCAIPSIWNPPKRQP